MRRLAITSGEAMTGFVASNIALKVADNATLPPDRQDWLPVQAFISAAATDKDLLGLQVANAAGVVRAASDPHSLNQPLEPVQTQGDVESGRSDIIVRRLAGAAGFRFVAPILYAGRRSGTVSLTLSSADLRNAATLAHLMMVMLAGVVLIGVVAATYIVLRAFDRPLVRLRQALEEAAAGGLDFRLSHNRTDEFGQLFDAFNRLCSTLQERLDNLEAMALEAGAKAQASVRAVVSSSPASLSSPSPEAGPAPVAASEPAASAAEPSGPLDPLDGSLNAAAAVTPFRRPARRRAKAAAGPASSRELGEGDVERTVLEPNEPRETP
jgi:serine/threonine-protein kinase